jgi:hypothetical protein
MSDLDTVLFAVGAFVFMMTIYGAVMAGGAVLKQKQLDDLPSDTDEIITDGGYEVFVTTHPTPD